MGRGHDRQLLLVHQDTHRAGGVDRDRPWPDRCFRAGRKVLAGIRRRTASRTSRCATCFPTLRRVRMGGAVQPHDIYDWEKATSHLAGQAPWWPPGTASGYHAINYGHLIGEVIRRATGKTLKEFVRDEIAEPMGADVQIGARQEDYHRIAEIDPAATAGPSAGRHACRPPDDQDLRVLSSRLERRRDRGERRVASRRHRWRQRARQCTWPGSGALADFVGRHGQWRAIAEPGHDRPDLRGTVQRSGPGADDPVAVRHRLRIALSGKRSRDSRRERSASGAAGAARWR